MAIGVARKNRYLTGEIGFEMNDMELALRNAFSQPSMKGIGNVIRERHCDFFMLVG